LAGNINIKNLPQNIIAPTNTTTINTLTKNKENKFIAARTRKTISKTELLKEVVGITKIFAKFINMIISRRDPNIVYENLIKKDSILLKIMIAKIISNKDKPSYEIAITNFEIF
jgi:hypothetical protein